MMELIIDGLRQERGSATTYIMADTRVLREHYQRCDATNAQTVATGLLDDRACSLGPWTSGASPPMLMGVDLFG